MARERFRPMKCAHHLLAGCGRFVLAGMLGIILFGAATVHASAASTSPAGVTKAQPSVAQQMAAQLKRKPGGTPIAWNELSYDHGQILVRFSASSSSSESTTLLPSIGYGGCPDGWVCVWQWYNYSGTEISINGYEPGDYVDLWLSYGFVGIGSYSSTNGAPSVSINDEWGNFDFSISSGVQHHSPNTSSNSDARYARTIWYAVG